VRLWRGLGFLTFTPDQSLQVVIYGGYWAMLLLTALFGRSLFKVARDSRRTGRLAARPALAAC